ncbi:rhodanese-like domain-containing protein [Halovulum dunhuangense]|uniref:Rhodanese-like domain-containing protein n=1 Tax=Halovulum dunhuangense TaxID=1505036 RepID=A0A849L044_9RHOB|nr:rhodanese-like domain-containing protein [Halovulum dunhuangense]NNU79120.1 rhodanese-like domain-containing protein [Halovulum dunhuangense]
MTVQASLSIDECDPEETWNALKDDPRAQLVDVRTRPEWSFVGIADLTALGRETILSEWRMYPDMRVNARFADDLFAAFDAQIPSQIFFICRSGARSLDAARAVAEVAAQRGLHLRCVNVAEGFEGDLDPHRHRGSMNGWKARGLAWIQS